MPASVQDSALYRGLFGDDEVARLFTDSAEVRAMLIVEGALAKVQGEAGVIPPEAGVWLHRACLEVEIEPASLAQGTARDGVPVPALVAAFRKTCGAPHHAQYLHWGATSQDIMDTALVLRLRQVLAILETRLGGVLAALAAQALRHADLPMAARTYGQTATPTSFGAVVAGWGRPLLRLRDRIEEMRPRLLAVQLGGAAGTLSAMGGRGLAIRAGLAHELGLADPGASWHAERDRIAELASWLTALTASLGKIGEDIFLMAQSGIAEIAPGGGGASSTMPQKSNPVAASALVALARHAAGLNANVQGAALHRQGRDGAAWFVEWLSLPQLCITAARALATAAALAADMVPDAARMRAALDADGGLIHAEAVTFALARRMPRPAAQAQVAALCAEARATGQGLLALAADRWPDEDWPAVAAQTGTAHDDALAFARAVAATDTG